MSLDQALNIDDHYSDLLEDFFDVRNKWETFGLRLGLTDATLESFQGDDEEKFRMVLKALLRGNRRDPCTPITLSRMLSALKSPTVGLTQLAEDLERKYTSESGEDYTNYRIANYIIIAVTGNNLCACIDVLL